MRTCRWNPSDTQNPQSKLPSWLSTLDRGCWSLHGRGQSGVRREGWPPSPLPHKVARQRRQSGTAGAPWRVPVGAIWTSPQLTQTGLETKNGMHPPNFPGARLSSFGTPHPPPPALLQGTRRSRNPGGPVLDTRQSPLQLKGGYGEGGLSGSRVRAGRAGVRPWPEMDGEAGRRHRPQNAQGPACTYCGAEGAGKGFPVCGGGG